MKTNKFFLIGLAVMALSLIACNNDNNGPGPDPVQRERNTHVSVALRLSGATRALPDDYNHIGTWAGQDKITSIKIYLVDSIPSVPVESAEFLLTDGAYTFDASTGILKPTVNAAIKTSAGKKNVYVVINETAAMKAHLNTPYPAVFRERYTESKLVLANSVSGSTVSTSASKLASTGSEATGYDNIVMTNVSEAILVVQEGVTAAETAANASPQNRASIEVERTVARVMITAAKDLTTDAPYDVVVDGNKIGEVSNLSWSLAQGEQALYIQRKDDWATPSHDWVPNDSTQPYINGVDGAWGKYDYSGLFESTTVAPLTAYAAFGYNGSICATHFGVTVPPISV